MSLFTSAVAPPLFLKTLLHLWWLCPSSFLRSQSLFFSGVPLYHFWDVENGKNKIIFINLKEKMGKAL